MSTDLDDLIRRDDELYDLDGKSDKVVAGAAPKSLGDRLDILAGMASVQVEHDAETGEIIEGAEQEQPVEQTPEIATGAGDHAAQPTVAINEANELQARETLSAAGIRSKSDAPTEASASKTEQVKKAGHLFQERQKTAAEDKRKALLADLTKQGDERTADGPRRFEEWIDGLNGDETALISAAQVKAWRNEAARAGQ
jgi:recombination protein RecT